MYSRKRVADGRQPSFRTWDDKPTATSQTIASGYTGTISTMEDNNNKDWRKAQKAGLIVMSPCHLARSTREFSSGSVKNFYTTHSGDVIGLAAPVAPACPLYYAEIDCNALLIATIAKIKGSATMSGENFGSLSQTLSMLRHPFRDTQKLLGKISKRAWANAGRPALAASVKDTDRYARWLKNERLRAAKDVSSAVANAWLEYRYGWKPIMMDIDTIFKESLKNLGEGDRLRQVVRSGKAASASNSAEGDPTIFMYGLMSAQGRCNRTKNIRAHSGVMFDLKNQTSQDDLARLFGTRASDVPATLWELTPWSFVIDWFVNVGDWIQAITPVPGLTLRDWWVTTVDSEEFTFSASSKWSATPDPLTGYTGSFGSETTRSLTVTRTVNQPISYIPALKLNPLSMLHQADAAALSLKPLLDLMQACRH